MKKPKQTAGIILAAGMSTRMGTPKQLLRFNGKHLLEHPVDAALASRLNTVILVLGYEHRRIRQCLESRLSHPRLRVVVNTDYAAGLSRSLRTGLAAAGTSPSVMVLLGDQPFIETGTIDLLLSRFWESKKDIVVPVCGKRRGPPVIFDRRFYDILNHIEGDIGAREVIAAHREDVLEVVLSDSTLLADIDTWNDLNALKTVDP